MNIYICFSCLDWAEKNRFCVKKISQYCQNCLLRVHWKILSTNRCVWNKNFSSFLDNKWNFCYFVLKSFRRCCQKRYINVLRNKSSESCSPWKHFVFIILEHWVEINPRQSQNTQPDCQKRNVRSHRNILKYHSFSVLRNFSFISLGSWAKLFRPYLKKFSAMTLRLLSACPWELIED